MGSLHRASALTILDQVLNEGIATRIRRRRRWCGRSLVVAILLLTRPRARGGYRMLMRGFARMTDGLLGWNDGVCASSLSRGRRLLPVDSMRQVLCQVVDRIAACAPRRFVHASARRFIAIDGTMFIMPRTRQTLAKFARPHAGTWLRAHYPQALTVIAVDLFKRLPLDWAMLSKGRGERCGATRLLGLFKPGDVAVLDRGYPSRQFLAELLQRQIDVVMRLPATLDGSWREVHDFLRSGESEKIYDTALPHGASTKIRLVRRNFRRGRPRKHQTARPMVVLTTLMPTDGFSADEIVELYQARWGVETVLREIKVAFDVERFHARSLVGIEQEIAAVLVWIALGSAIEHAAEDRLPPGRRVYRTICHEWATIVVQTLFEGGDATARLEEAIATTSLDHYRPKAGRSFPRERKWPHGRTRNGSH